MLVRRPALPHIGHLSLLAAQVQHLGLTYSGMTACSRTGISVHAGRIKIELDSEHHWALQLIQGLAEIALAIKHCNIECISVNDQTITKANFAKMSHIGQQVSLGIEEAKLPGPLFLWRLE